MLIPCPLCGPRDIREFTYRGHATYLDRPETEDWSEAWDDYLHNRENKAGIVAELWCHTQGCGAWLIVERDTVTHRVISAKLLAEEDA